MESGPELEHHHHHTGRQWVDVALGVALLVISVISLLLAMENGQAMRRLVAANSWPFVDVGTSNADANGDPILGLLMQNKGVGPAKIETLEVLYAGRPISDSQGLIHAILGPRADKDHVPLLISSVVGGVLSSKEQIYFLTVNDRKINPVLMKQLSGAASDIGIRVCYCSVFDECWIQDRTRSTSLPPTQVKSCPAPKTPFRT